MEIHLTKLQGGLLAPANPDTEEAIGRMKLGQVIRADFKKVKNYKFHKKWFALVRFAYDHWEPAGFDDAKWGGVSPEKTFDRFRRDITILAGYFDATYRVDGSVRIEAKSISFGKMSEDDFAILYDKTINVILQKILINYDKDELDRVVNNLLGFM